MKQRCPKLCSATLRQIMDSASNTIPPRFLLQKPNSKVKSAYEPSGPSGRSLSRFPWHEATRSYCISTPPWMGCQGTGYSQHFAGTHLHTWVERGTVGVKCLAQEHNTMFPARNRTRAIRSGVEHTSHEATAPPKNLTVTVLKETTTATATPTPKSSIILLVKRGKHDRASCAASIFVHFCSVLVKTTTQNDQFSGFHDNVGKQH